ncbi:MAG: hypothetical protein AMK75_00160 [Planctomycetes bacterium SM23_65]|nr:MAG: hypothetical protein AMK75_00160 [Planctomycetes bacterium SM23_65]
MLGYFVLAIVAVLLAPIGPFYGWVCAPFEHKSVVLSAVALVEAVVYGISIAVLWKVGLLRFLKIAIEFLLLVIVAFTCLALGGAPTWTWLVLEIVVALAVILWAVRMLAERRLSYVKTPLNLLLLLLLAYIFFQLLPLPAGILRISQPGTLRVHTVGPPQVAQAASLPLEGGGSFSISLNRMRTRGHLLLWAAYVGFFLVFINNVRGREQLGRMVGTLVAIGAIVAVSGFATAKQDERLLYRTWPAASMDEKPPILNWEANPEFSAGFGFVFAASEGDRVDFYVPKVHVGDVFGGFASSNSAATVMLMALALSLGVFFAYVSTRREEWGRSGGLLYTREGNITLLVLFIAVLLVCGLALSRSRVAVALVVVGVPVLIVLVGFCRSWLAGLLSVIVSPLVVAVLMVVLTVFLLLVTGAASELLSSRAYEHPTEFVREKVSGYFNPWEEETRFIAREATWRIVGDYPLFGTGLGTFCSVYPSYKIRGPMLYFAHCDPLQWFAEMGLVGSGLVAAILLSAVVTVVVGWFRLKDPFFRRLLLGSVCACLAFLIHGLLDFPLQIPGVAMFFVAAGAVSIVIARDRVARHEEKSFVS